MTPTCTGTTKLYLKGLHKTRGGDALRLNNWRPTGDSRSGVVSSIMTALLKTHWVRDKRELFGDPNVGGEHIYTNLRS